MAAGRGRRHTSARRGVSAAAVLTSERRPSTATFDVQLQVVPPAIPAPGCSLLARLRARSSLVGGHASRADRSTGAPAARNSTRAPPLPPRLRRRWRRRRRRGGRRRRRRAVLVLVLLRLPTAASVVRAAPWQRQRSSARMRGQGKGCGGRARAPGSKGRPRILPDSGDRRQLKVRLLRLRRRRRRWRLRRRRRRRPSPGPSPRRAYTAHLPPWLFQSPHADAIRVWGHVGWCRWAEDEKQRLTGLITSEIPPQRFQLAGDWAQSSALIPGRAGSRRAERCGRGAGAARTRHMAARSTWAVTTTRGDQSLTAVVLTIPRAASNPSHQPVVIQRWCVAAAGGRAVRRRSRCSSSRLPPRGDGVPAVRRSIRAGGGGCAVCSSRVLRDSCCGWVVLAAPVRSNTLDFPRRAVR